MDHTPQLLQFHSTTLIAALAVFAAGLGLRYLLTPKPIGTIPCNPPRFLFGDILSINEYVSKGIGLGTWLSDLSLRRGPITTVHIGPFLTKVVVTDPREVEDIMSRRHHEFGFSPIQGAIFGGAMPKGQLSIPSDKMWKSHRRILKPSMSPAYHKLITPRITSVVKQLCHLWERKQTLMPVDSCLDVIADLQLATMDSISAFAFVRPFGGMKSAHDVLDELEGTPEIDGKGIALFPFPDVQMHNAVRVLFQAMGDAVLSPVPKFSYWINHRRNAWKSAHRLWSDYVAVSMQDAREAFAEKGTLTPVDGLNGTESIAEMVIRREEQDEVLDDDELQDELLTLLLAGQDTTSATLAWCLKLMSHHPEVQWKLRQHLSSRCGLNGTSDDPELQYEDVQTENVPYLEAVVTECLRYGQIGLLISRQATCDTQILGHVIPKGTEIALHMGHGGIHDTEANLASAAQWDPVRGHKSKKKTRSWKDDGKAFNPDRWIDEDGKYDAKAGFCISFGGGPRLCFGQRVAMLQLKLFLAALNARFFFETPKNPDLNGWKVKETVTRSLEQTYVVVKSWDEGSA